jgi:hypothetical protein
MVPVEDDFLSRTCQVRIFPHTASGKDVLVERPYGNHGSVYGTRVFCFQCRSKKL